MKKLSVVVAGTGQIRDVEIQPGTTRRRHPPPTQPAGLPAEQGSERALLRRRRVGLRQGQGRREDLRVHQSRGRHYAYARKRSRHHGLPPMPSARSFRGWCGGTPPPFPSSAARSRTGRNAAGPATDTITRDPIRRPTRRSKAGSKRAVRPASNSSSIIPRARSGATAIGPVFPSRQRLVLGPHGAAAQRCQLGNHDHRTTYHGGIRTMKTTHIDEKKKALVEKREKLIGQFSEAARARKDTARLCDRNPADQRFSREP